MTIFFSKAQELIEWHSKNLPAYNASPEEIEAGWPEFQKKFASYAQIDQVARKIHVTEEVLYRDWSAREFWFKHLYLAWESYHQSEYNRILTKK
jgi:hypothetical protein